MTRIELASGAYAELRDPGPLKAKHRKQVARALHDSDRIGANAVDMIDGVIAVLVVDWNVTDPDSGEPLPLPSLDLESLEEIADDDYEALSSHPMVAAMAQRILKARVEVADNPDGALDDASPSAPSAESTPVSTEGDPRPATP